MLKVLSYHIADSIDIKGFKFIFTAELLHADSDELFYTTPSKEFIYVFKYGVVCFFNYSDLEVSSFLQLISPYCHNLTATRLSEELLIETGAAKINVGFNKIEVPGIEPEVLRLIMLNVSQSVALDLYLQQTNTLLEETNFHTQNLERKGKLDLSGKNLKKYIGRTLNIKNHISQNLYIFDSPDETWDDEQLNRLDNSLKKAFDLQVRFRTIQDGIGIVKENLELFKDILQYRNSTQLEWIIIILILIEVVNLFFEKLFK